MIKHPVVRTRVLYEWERRELERLTSKHILSQQEMQAFASKLYKADHRMSAPPIIHRVGTQSLTHTQGLPYSWGRSDIYLDRRHSHLVVLIHELTHAMGYGSGDNPHNKAFVQKYISLLAKWLRPMYTGISRSGMYQHLTFVARAKGLL